MNRLVIVMLTLLVVVAFFVGLRLGKYIQRIDTPVQIKYQIKEKIVVVTPTPTPTGKVKRQGLGNR